MVPMRPDRTERMPAKEAIFRKVKLVSRHHANKLIPPRTSIATRAMAFSGHGQTKEASPCRT
nr:hypothetical protein SHINE37_110318 [Rhizobiaceae bacterium]